MTANEAIYVINQSPNLARAWRELSKEQKKMVVEACAAAEESDLERIIEEVVDGQRRLF